LKLQHWLVLAGVASALGAGAAEALALVPEEVLVVANANADGSVPLARYYALSRNILPERIIVLRCTAEPEVSREEYNQNIRDPIREYLKRRDPKGQIRCLALVWGVPVRVSPTAQPAEKIELLQTYKTLRERLHGRMGVDLKLLETVGVSFSGHASAHPPPQRPGPAARSLLTARVRRRRPRSAREVKASNAAEPGSGM
jgi:hypothetical protein